MKEQHAKLLRRSMSLRVAAKDVCKLSTSFSIALELMLEWILSKITCVFTYNNDKALVTWPLTVHSFMALIMFTNTALLCVRRWVKTCTLLIWAGIFLHKPRAFLQRLCTFQPRFCNRWAGTALRTNTSIKIAFNTVKLFKFFCRTVV